MKHTIEVKDEGSIGPCNLFAKPDELCTEMVYRLPSTLLILNLADHQPHTCGQKPALPNASGHNANVSVTINFHHVRNALEQIVQTLQPQYISLDDVVRIHKAADVLASRKLDRHGQQQFVTKQEIVDVLRVAKTGLQLAGDAATSRGERYVAEARYKEYGKVSELLKKLDSTYEATHT